KLIGSDAVGPNVLQGSAVAIAASGNTALVGAPGDNGGTGAVWVWTRKGDTWSQQGGKLVASSAVGNARQGTSVALSANGDTAIVGGPFDAGTTGAAWIWTRKADVWTEQAKLVGLGAVGPNVFQGGKGGVALSNDGNTAVVGGPFDDGEKGAVWVFTRAHD